MRRIHHDITPICEFVADHNFEITRLSGAGQSAGESFTVQHIEQMLEQSETLWGTNLGYFLIVAHNKSKENMDIRTAVEYAESGKLDGFILIAYQDGGIISVSNKIYPFQEEAEPAVWWHV